MEPAARQQGWAEPCIGPCRLRPARCLPLSACQVSPSVLDSPSIVALQVAKRIAEHSTPVVAKAKECVLVAQVRQLAKALGQGRARGMPLKAHCCSSVFRCVRPSSLLHAGID